MRDTRTDALRTLARAGQAHWFFGNLYEAVVHMPERLTPDDRMFGPGSPVRYHLPAAPITLGATAATVLRGWRRADDRPALAVAGTATVVGAALTGHLVHRVNRRLLSGEPLPAAERQRLVRHWHRVNRVRLLLAGSALIALHRLPRPH